MRSGSGEGGSGNGVREMDGLYGYMDRRRMRENADGWSLYSLPLPETGDTIPYIRGEKNAKQAAMAASCPYKNPATLTAYK